MSLHLDFPRSTSAPIIHEQRWFPADEARTLSQMRFLMFTAIQRGIDSCKTTGYEPEHQFRGDTKMITHGKGGQREVEDFPLLAKAQFSESAQPEAQIKRNLEGFGYGI